MMSGILVHDLGKEKTIAQNYRNTIMNMWFIINCF